MRTSRSRRCWLAGTLALFAIAGVAPTQTANVNPTPLLAGRIVDETGAPLAGAAVALAAVDEFVDTAALLAHPTTVSGADGRYELAVRDKASVLLLAAAGRQAVALQLLHDVLGTGGDIGEVVLVPGSKLVGRVRDEAGKPLVGVRLQVGSSIVGRFNHWRRLLAGAVSDAKGIFVVPCVAESGLRLIVEAPGYLTCSRLVAQETPLDLTLEHVGMVRGVVRDGDGQPIAGARVSTITVEARDAIDPIRSATDGTFAITVPKRGRFRIAAYEQGEPFRRFSSGLLHGPAEDIEVVEVVDVVVRQTPATSPRTLAVSALDAASKAPIGTFSTAVVPIAAKNLSLALLWGRGRGRRGENGETIELGQDSSQHCLLVEAPGHGFEVVAIPPAGDAITVELGAEATLEGRVIDRDTREPVAGVAVRALPIGDSSSTGGTVADIWPRTDANGRYRIAGLRPGEYGVQTYAEGRPATRPVRVTLAAAANTCDLEAPEERWIEVEITGRVPPGPACQLSVDNATFSQGSDTNYFAHTVPVPAPIAITRAGRLRIGPIGHGQRRIQLWVPSRTRSATGTGTMTDWIDPDGEPTTIALPEVGTRIVMGHVELPKDVATERVVVLATPAAAGAPPMFAAIAPRQQPNVAGLTATGRFTIDLPRGRYCLQLADLETGVVFHTETDDRAIEDDTEIVLRPTIRWLELEFAPEHPDNEVVLHSIVVSLASPRQGIDAFLQRGRRHDDVVTTWVPFRCGATRQRWLVPGGEIELQAMQTFDILQPWARGSAPKGVANATVDCDAPVQQVRLVIPAPPSDEELMRRDR
ncbi:MAG: carboxypeptidase regulatory-like domain-containing protein [Planctomycetes bacterium]|nr:carboxypeptidase regulatory-like domain-containing protein [Planctomycetota bacterium]